MTATLDPKLAKDLVKSSKRYDTTISRRITRTVMVGDIPIGSDHPVRVQSMINEDTLDIEGSTAAIRRLHEIGCEIVRLTVPSLAHAKAVGEIKNLLESNDVSLPAPNTKPISKSKLGKMISDGTYYLSCWMTMAQIEKMKSRKVIFQSLD